jgi:hypothetical protein
MLNGETCEGFGVSAVTLPDFAVKARRRESSLNKRSLALNNL